MALAFGAAWAIVAACGGAPAPRVAAPTRFADETDTFALSAPPDPARRRQFAALVPAIDRLLTAIVDEGQAPGLAVGIVLDGEVVYAKGFGVRDVATRAPFDRGSVFRIASVTKSFVALSVLALRDEGKIDLDRPAADYYPPLARLAYPTRDSPPITVRDLLTHASGLPEDNYWVDAAGEVTDAALAALIDSGMRFSRAPGSGFEYSNTAFALLGKIVERVSGMPMREHVRKTILLPLGMTSTGWSPDEVGRARLVVGYRGDAGYHVGGGRRVVAPIAPLGAYDAAGGLYASIDDMAKYVAFQLSAWPPRNAPDRGPVRRSTVRETHEGARRADPRAFPRVLLPSRAPAVVRVRDGAPSLFAYSYGFGWFTATTCEDDFYVHHDGELPGYETAVALYPARGYGIVTFVDDERATAYPADDVTRLLREAGVIDVVPPAPVPALDAARDEVLRLVERWDDARAEALLAPTFWRYQSRETLRAQLAALASAHGRCRADGDVEVTNRTRGRWRLACDRGAITFVAALSPAAEPRLQTLLWEDTLPPSAPLARAAGVVASWTKRWDDAAATTLLAATMDVDRARRTLARVALERGACDVERPLASDGATSGRFRLACGDGAVELALSIDAAARITTLEIARPRTAPNCAW